MNESSVLERGALQQLSARRASPFSILCAPHGVVPSANPWSCDRVRPDAVRPNFTMRLCLCTPVVWTEWETCTGRALRRNSSKESSVVGASLFYLCAAYGLFPAQLLSYDQVRRTLPAKLIMWLCLCTLVEKRARWDSRTAGRNRVGSSM